MSEENELPSLPIGWYWTTLAQLVTKINDGVHNTPKYVEDGIPFISVNNISENGIINFSHCKYITIEEHKELYKRCNPEQNDILLSKVGTVGLTSVVNTKQEFSLFVNLALIKPIRELISSEYLSFVLRYSFLSNFYQSFINGSTQRFIGIAKINILPIPLSPLFEQHRIVAAIEQQFTRLDAAITALQHTKAKLKRYRASVLKAAVEGKLTEAWRAEHPTTEPASVLLERILIERRAKWEADLRAKGKDPAKVKYVEPAMPDVERPPELPEEWIWVNLGQLTWSVKDGPHYSPKYDKTGIPFITGGNVRPSGVDFANAKYITPELHAELSARCKPEKGDILYTKGGTTGIARVNTYDTDFNVWVHVAVLKLADSITPFYVQHALNSPSCYRQAQNFTHGVGNQDLGLTRMVRIVLGLPPLAEQLQIVAEIEKRLSVIDHLEEAIQANLKRAERLRQSILKEAFAGRLVPQDPNDEPASVLLERIHKEREGQKQGPIKKARTIKTISAPRMPDVEPMEIDASEMEQMDLWASIGGRE